MFDLQKFNPFRKDKQPPLIPFQYVDLDKQTVVKFDDEDEAREYCENLSVEDQIRLSEDNGLLLLFDLLEVKFVEVNDDAIGVVSSE